MDVHAPYQPPANLRKRFVTVEGTDRYTSGPPEGGISADDLAYLQGLYDGEVRFVDGVIRALVEHLEAAGRWERTLLIVASDHGDEFMDHGGLGHGTSLEQELIRVPLLVAGGRLAAFDGPRRIDTVVRNLDIAPSILDAAGIPLPESFEGRSLLRLLAGETEGVPPGTAFAQIGNLWSLVDRDWHFIWNRDFNEVTLYDNQADPRGTTDLADRHPRIVHQMRQGIEALMALQASSRAASTGEDAPAVDPAILEQLEALGYL